MEIYFCETNEIFEKAAMFGLQANMTMYLTEQYHLSSALASGVCNEGDQWGRELCTLSIFFSLVLVIF
jgi:hypothetical protein